MVTYAAALEFLNRRRVVDFETADTGLTLVKMLFQVYMAYRNLYPEDFREKLQNVPSKIKDLNWKNKQWLYNKVQILLMHLFPIWVDAMDEDPMVIYIEPQRPSMSWDEFDELIEDPQSSPYSNEHYTFPVLCWTIANGVNEETWASLSDIYNWNITYPKRLNGDTWVDLDEMAPDMETAGLEDFLSALKIIWQATDNLFLDLDQNDDDPENFPPLTAANICKLARLWQEAQPLLEANQRAELRILQEPDVLAQVVEIMEKHCKDRKND